MNTHELVSQLIDDTKGLTDQGFWSISQDSSLWLFRPELVLCATIVLMLLVRVLRWDRLIDSFYIVLVGSGVALWMAAPWNLLIEGGVLPRQEIFTGMLVYDTFSVYIRAVLLFFVVLFALFTKLSGLPAKDDGPDIYTLVLGATLGMCLMASANHLLMVFLAVEMASVPSYVLAGMLKGRKQSSEAALKYAVFGAGAAGVMLYGISLVAGLLNTAHLPTMAIQLADRLPEMTAEPGQLMVLVLGGLMIMVGLAFKLSAVPFHFWCPDVFEGATAEVNAFLSVASKAAALALLVRVAIGFTWIPSGAEMVVMESATEVSNSEPAAVAFDHNAGSAAFFSITDDSAIRRLDADHLEQSSSAPTSSSSQATADSEHETQKQISERRRAALLPVRGFIGRLIAFFAIITCTFGNLTAYAQTNIKRLMAYSTIAHAGYMMMAIPALLAMASYNSAAAGAAISALCVYIFVYVFMNLAAFSIIAFLRNAMRSEEIADYAGLFRRCPMTVILFSVVLFSLVGLPPLAGFIGKFLIFAELVHGYEITSAAGRPETYLLVVLLAGGINTVISLFYYLRVVKTMTMSPEPENRTPFTFSTVSPQGAYIWLVATPCVLLFVFWEKLNLLASAAAQQLLS